MLTETKSEIDIYDDNAVGTVSLTSLGGLSKACSFRVVVFFPQARNLGTVFTVSPVCFTWGLFPLWLWCCFAFVQVLLDDWDCRRSRYFYRIIISNAELVVYVWRQLCRVALILVIIVIINDVINNCFCLSEFSGIPEAVSSVVFYVVKEAFLWGIVPAVVFSGHGLV